MQSTQHSGLHVAIIMDGNGRWATARSLPRVAGHREGAKAVRRTVEAAPGLGIGTLTLYAFSSDNWRRPQTEVETLMRLFEVHLKSETGRCIENGVRISVIGRRDRLGTRLAASIASAERATARCTRLHLRVAVDYSARDVILRAAQRVQGRRDTTREAFARLLAEAEHSPGPVPEVDLLIRTASEQRLSDFLLWECAYAELLFVPKFWPDFGADDLASAVEEFRNRERRFGGLPVAAAG
jgi:undecaprenyl diphosphate synthase